MKIEIDEGYVWWSENGKHVACIRIDRALELLQLGIDAAMQAAYITEDWRGMTHPIVAFRDLPTLAILQKEAGRE